MRLAVSNIALPPFDHKPELHALADMGFSGLEVAPSRVWKDTITINPDQVATYRRTAESAGLSIVGVHSLFFDQPSLGLFRDRYTRRQTIDYLVHLSSVCRDLGGKTMVFGSGGARKRGELPVNEADRETVRFFSEVVERIADHGTCIVLEALSAEFSDYIDTHDHAQRIVDAVDHPAMRSHLDMNAAAAADEINRDVVEKMSPTLKHVHVNEPGLGELSESSAVDHALAGTLLREAEYGGYCSLEQRMLNPNDVMSPLKRSMARLKEWYA